MIFSQYEVVRTILSNLPLQDLRSAAQVCSLWQSIAKIILRSRSELQWFFVSPRVSIEEILKTKLYSEPKLCIMFSTKTQRKSTNCVCSHVGPGCVTLQVQSSGIVGTKCDSLETEEIEGDRRFYASILLIPAISGVTCKTFKLSHSELSNFKYMVDLSPEELLEYTSIGPADDVKCVLLFSIGFSEHLKRLVLAIRNREDERLVLGGAICYAKQDILFGVAFLGANVTAASMLLPSSVTKKSTAESYFEKFRKDTSCIEAKQTVCFMFPCVGRGKAMYGERNVESSLFRKYFPSTPLVGFFGFGELGYDSVPTDGNPMPNPSHEDFDTFYTHDFSTVFVYLGFS